MAIPTDAAAIPPASGLFNGYGRWPNLWRCLLDPSVIYVPFVTRCQQTGICLKYAGHITGQAAELMRLDESFIYRITDVGRVPEIFRFVQKNGPVDIKEAYATFNMGAGFAVYVSPGDRISVSSPPAGSEPRRRAGSVVKQDNTKAVQIVPLDITFTPTALPCGN